MIMPLLLAPAAQAGWFGYGSAGAGAGQGLLRGDDARRQARHHDAEIRRIQAETRRIELENERLERKLRHMRELEQTRGLY